MASALGVLAGWVEADGIVLELVVRRAGRPEVVRRGKLAVAPAAGLGAALAGFLAGAGETPNAACIATPGPVIRGRSHSDALPWLVDERELRAAIGNLRVVDQAAAAAAGVPQLRQSDLVALQAGDPSPRGPIAVAHVGGSFSFALMLRGASRFRILQSATGESDFAPRGVIERALATHLEKRVGRASLSHVLSARGLRTVLDFLAASMQPVGGDAELALAQDEDDPWVVLRLALEGRDDACMQALITWATILGEEAGGAALRALPTGGVYLSGELVARALPVLRNGALIRAFVDKGEMGPLMASLPVHVVLEPRLPLIGAAHAAFLATDGRWPV